MQICRSAAAFELSHSHSQPSIISAQFTADNELPCFSLIFLSRSVITPSASSSAVASLVRRSFVATWCCKRLLSSESHIRNSNVPYDARHHHVPSSRSSSPLLLCQSLQRSSAPRFQCTNCTHSSLPLIHYIFLHLHRPSHSAHFSPLLVCFFSSPMQPLVSHYPQPVIPSNPLLLTTSSHPISRRSTPRRQPLRAHRQDLPCHQSRSPHARPRSHNYHTRMP